MHRIRMIALALLGAIVATLFVALPAEAAHNRYPICVQNRAGSWLNQYVHNAAVDWNTDGVYLTKKSSCTGRMALEIHVFNAHWGRNGVLGKAYGYYRYDSRGQARPYYCKVYLNKDYPNSGTRKYQRTIAHEMGHCFQMMNERHRHYNGHYSIMNPYRYSVNTTHADEYFIEARWSRYNGYHYGR